MVKVRLLARLVALSLCLFPLIARPAEYVLGPGDQVTISVLEPEDIGSKATTIDSGGYVDLPLVGRVRAAGLTPGQLSVALVEKLREYVREPQVSVSVGDLQSQPVSILGSVNRPGVHQLRGRKTLVEILSLAEGLRPDAGPSVHITRRLDLGEIPLDTARRDPSGEFTVATINLKSVLEARNPRQNIPILPYDVISVPKAEMIYVIGEVRKSGGFVLQDNETLSVLEALSLAEGLSQTASAQNAKVLRSGGGQPKRTELPVDVRKILTGKAPDVALRPNDILFIPGSAARNAALRGIETAIQIGTGVAIFRR